MGAFADALAQTQQFIMDRQLQDQQGPAPSSIADAAQQSIVPNYGSGMLGQVPAMMQQMQSMPGGGQMGGFSGSKTGHLETEHGVTGNARAMSMLDRVAQQYPQLWNNVESSYRTRQQQAQMYNDYLHHGGNLAAPPGHSMHEKGLAFDINASWIDAHPGLRQLLDRLGGFPVGGEPWHWQPRWTI